jgi:hypothetical protein
MEKSLKMCPPCSYWGVIHPGRRSKPCPDKDKPIERQGQKATGLNGVKIAKLRDVRVALMRVVWLFFWRKEGR